MMRRDLSLKTTLRDDPEIKVIVHYTVEPGDRSVGIDGPYVEDFQVIDLATGQPVVTTDEENDHLVDLGYDEMQHQMDDRWSF